MLRYKGIHICGKRGDVDVKYEGMVGISRGQGVKYFSSCVMCVIFCMDLYRISKDSL